MRILAGGRREQAISDGGIGRRRGHRPSRRCGAGEDRVPRPLPRFGTDIEVVNLSVSVADTGRATSPTSSQQDFTVLEDGVRQELSVFDQQQAPVSVSILIDCSLSMQPCMAMVQAAALRLVHALRPMDSAQIVRFNHRHTVVQEFTSDQALLEAGIHSIRPEGATGLYNAVYLSLRDLARQQPGGEVPAARRRPAFGWGGHHVPPERRPGAGGGANGRGDHLCGRPRHRRADRDPRWRDRPGALFPDRAHRRDRRAALLPSRLEPSSTASTTASPGS